MVIPLSSGVDKNRSNVKKVIQKIRNKNNIFDNIQDERIANVLKDLFLKKDPIQIHPKMRQCDIEEIRSLGLEFCVNNTYKEEDLTEEERQTLQSNSSQTQEEDMHEELDNDFLNSDTGDDLFDSDEFDNLVSDSELYDNDSESEGPVEIIL